MSLDRAELFAYAYIQHMGNATAAAREVFGIKSNAYASKKGSEMVRKRKVKELIEEYLNAQRENFKKFVDQGPYYLTLIARRLCEVIEDKETSFDDLMRAIETLARFAGRELSEAVTIAQVRAEATRPLPEQRQPAGGSNIDRKVLFLLSPPPMPPGGVPTPALDKQWREMGWKPAYEAENDS